MSFWLPLALAVPGSRQFRSPLSLVRVRCCFWSPRVADVSFVLKVVSRLALVLPLAFGLGFGRAWRFRSAPRAFSFDTKQPPARFFGAGQGALAPPPNEPF